MNNSKLNLTIEKYSAEEQKAIKKAYNFARLAHSGQKRFSGDEYFIHPVNVSNYLISLNLDKDTIVTALLHDVVEDTHYTTSDIEKNFGNTIAQMVDSLSKLSSVRLKDEMRQKSVLENSDTHSPYLFERQLGLLRKMFLAMAQDIRVVLIKLADRRHNMQTLEYVPQEKQRRIALETLEIYAPLAYRLGMGELKGELEDLAFKYVYPQEYIRFQKLLGNTIEEHKSYILRVQKEISDGLKLFNIKHSIDGRVKHFYSLYKKMTKKNKKLSQIYDLVAVRVMVETVEDCYMVLGILHQLWKPLKASIKDYIAIPKPNGYQSLHTTVFGPEGKITEIQIRTYQMHEQAENGVAAHWHYTGQIKDPDLKPEFFNASSDETAWVKKLAEIIDSLAEKKISPEDAKIDFFQDRIFTFTPKGDVHELPLGSTPIDFAYLVHTDIGNTCYGARVNGKMVKLHTQLNNGDMVEILTNKKSRPKEDWLNFVKTNQAKTVIKHYLKEN